MSWTPLPMSSTARPGAVDHVLGGVARIIHRVLHGVSGVVHVGLAVALHMAVLVG